MSSPSSTKVAAENRDQEVLDPLVEELHPAPEAQEVFERLAGRSRCLFLDSARRHDRLGRYSFVTADPFDFFQLPATGEDGFAELARRMSIYQSTTVQDLPPFQGGAAGLLSYDLAHTLEKLPRPKFDEFQVPAIAIGFYDVVVAFDHLQQRAWIISQGFPELLPEARRDRAHQRIKEVRAWLEQPKPPTRHTAQNTLTEVTAQALAPQFPVDRSSGGSSGLTSNFSKDGYIQAIGRAIEYIHAGDIFQVNIAQRLLYPAHCDSIDLYLRLRQRNPATFGGYFDLGDFQMVSASPERFLRVSDSQVEARPIKGTRQRTATPEADLFAGDELKQSEKDRAENVMIVDLLRNDLSRVCRADSVRVTELCHLETYQYVQHLVSAICGTLRDPYSAVDLLRAAFPGGSITGAPKVRAMEIISQLEPTARGPYCGALGYLGFDGAMDTSILIRTITAGRGWWQAPVGGGIVAQSDPLREYEETWHKAEGLIRALQ